MKKLPLIFITAFLIAAFSSLEISARIYPAITNYFKTLQQKDARKSNLSSLETIRYNLTQTEKDTLVMICSGNSFRSQALQIFLETKLMEKRKRKIEVVSCGMKTMAIDERLITYLKKIGYQVEIKQHEGADAYFVRFSDSYNPIILYPKNCDNSIIPQKPFISVLACKETAGSCEKLSKANINIELNYKDRSELANQAEFENEVNQIATDVNLIFRKQ